MDQNTNTGRGKLTQNTPKTRPLFINLHMGNWACSTLGICCIHCFKISKGKTKNIL